MKVSFSFRPFIQLEHLYITIDFFSIIIFILIFFILFILIRKNRISNKQKAVRGILEEWIMKIVLEEPDNADHIFDIPDWIALLLKNKLAKNVLLQELIKLKKSLSGVSGNNVRKIYEQLRLDELSRQRMRSKKWHLKAQGIQELAIMNQHTDGSNILSLTNHKHPMVRMEAQTAMVRLKKYKGLNFFNTLSYPITEWQQVNLLQLLVNQPVAPVHAINNWLQSSNAPVLFNLH